MIPVPGEPLVTARILPLRRAADLAYGKEEEETLAAENSETGREARMAREHAWAAAITKFVSVRQYFNAALC